jgi:hypothetical protein
MQESIIEATRENQLEQLNSTSENQNNKLNQSSKQKCLLLEGKEKTKLNN